MRFKTVLRRRLEVGFESRGFDRSSGWNRVSSADTTRPKQRASHADRVGLNLYGYFSRWLGLGECARLHADTLLAAGWPVALLDLDLDVPHRRLDTSLAEHLVVAPMHGVDLVFVNPDHWSMAIEKASLDPRKRYLIAYWFWELERFPAQWLPALDQVDEVMVATRFVEQAIRQVTDKPVSRVPMPVRPIPASALTRHDFGLPENHYIFLASFDFHSSIARKNPYAVISAFKQAFPKRVEPVTLLFKTSNGGDCALDLAHLIAAAAGDPRIVIRDDMLERHHMEALRRGCDAYVSLHRCEGFGLGMAEAMRLGKPVVATGYSGNMDYMNAENSCVVGYTMVPVREGEYPGAAGQLWAEPDVSHAARCMRWLVTDPARGEALGRRAAEHMAANYSDQMCLQALDARLRAIEDRISHAAAGLGH